MVPTSQKLVQLKESGRYQAIKRGAFPVRALGAGMYDLTRFVRAAGGSYGSEGDSTAVARAQIEVHRVEKGLCMQPFDVSRGLKAESAAKELLAGVKDPESLEAFEEVLDAAAGSRSSGLSEGMRSHQDRVCLLYTSPSPRDRTRSRMPSSA